MPHYKAKIVMEAVSSPSHPIGALHGHHFHICGLTGLAKFPPQKQTSSYWPVEILCMDNTRGKILEE